MTNREEIPDTSWRDGEFDEEEEDFDKDDEYDVDSIMQRFGIYSILVFDF